MTFFSPVFSIQNQVNPKKLKSCYVWASRYLNIKDETYTNEKLKKYINICIDNYQLLLKYYNKN